MCLCHSTLTLRNLVDMTQTRDDKAAVVFTGVVKTFGRAGRSVRAADGIELTMRRGETVAPRCVAAHLPR